MARSVVRKSISFEERDVETVSRVAKLVGGFSAALRLIIRQWATQNDAAEAEMAEQRVKITDEGRAALRELAALRDCDSIDQE